MSLAGPRDWHRTIGLSTALDVMLFWFLGFLERGFTYCFFSRKGAKERYTVFSGDYFSQGSSEGIKEFP